MAPTPDALGRGGQAPGGLEIEWVLGQPPVARTRARAATTKYSHAPGDIHSIWLNGTVIFVGTIDEVNEALLGGRTDYLEVALTMLGHEYILTRRTVTIPVSTPTVASLISTIQTDVLAGEGIALGTVDNDTASLAFADYTKIPVSDLLDMMAEAIGGYWYVSAWPPTLYLREHGSTSAPWALSTSVAVKNINARQHRDEYYNVIYVDNGSIVISDTNAAEIAARAAAEGGTGRYERVVSVDDSYTQAQMETHAARMLARHDEFGWEVSYTCSEALGEQLRTGMVQTVNLEDEFGIPAATDMRVQRLTLREVSTSIYEWDVTLHSVDLGLGWERSFRDAFRAGLPYGRPRYYRP